jgi:hypothetical protein
MMLANIPAVILGDRIADELPVKAIRITAAVVFAGLGVVTLVGVGRRRGTARPLPDHLKVRLSFRRRNSRTAERPLWRYPTVDVRSRTHAIVAPVDNGDSTIDSGPSSCFCQT